MHRSELIVILAVSSFALAAAAPAAGHRRTREKKHCGDGINVNSPWMKHYCGHGMAYGGAGTIHYYVISVLRFKRDLPRSPRPAHPRLRAHLRRRLPLAPVERRPPGVPGPVTER